LIRNHNHPYWLLRLHTAAQRLLSQEENMLKKISVRLSSLGAIVSLLLYGCSAPATPAPTATPQPDIKVGILIPYTGIGAAVAQALEPGYEFAFAEINYEIAGRKVVLIKEDETDDPNAAVQKARKLVEEDKVDVVLGPLLAHTAAAVSGYLTPTGVPHIVVGASDAATSPHTFYPGSGHGDSYVTGVFAAEDLKATRAAIIYMDYLFGQQSRDGFKSGFTDNGGTVISEQPVPFGAADMAPFLEGIQDADVVAVLLTNPSDFAFVRQYRQAGLTMPVIFISNAPQEAPLLAQMGDDVVGMYGSSWYSPMIDSATNKAFVEKFSAQYGFPPGIATHTAYMAALMFIKAAQASKGDTSHDAINNALVTITDLDNPAGKITLGPSRVATHDQFIFQVGKAGDFYVWNVVKQYEAVAPR
jgi:branched-chain amino acid transport system substrate-binding protein